MNLVENNMTQELANELFAKGIAFDVASPKELTNIGGQSIIVSAHFTETKRSSQAWWQVRNGATEKRANSLSEVMEVLISYNVKTRLDLELLNLVNTIRLTGHEAEIKKDCDTYYNKRLAKSVTCNSKVIDVILYGAYPCYCFEGKWTFHLTELFTWLEIDPS